MLTTSPPAPSAPSSSTSRPSHPQTSESLMPYGRCPRRRIVPAQPQPASSSALRPLIHHRPPQKIRSPANDCSSNQSHRGSGSHIHISPDPREVEPRLRLRRVPDLAQYRSHGQPAAQSKTQSDQRRPRHPHQLHALHLAPGKHKLRAPLRAHQLLIVHRLQSAFAFRLVAVDVHARMRR